ncbi:Rad51B protein, partial [Ephemerocybe angulata]
TFADMLVAPLSDVARRCKLSPQDAKVIYDRLLKECPMTKMINLKELKQPLDQQFSTGDDVLDRALGGGIRTGMVWELAGESSAGKTQLALQTSLTVQLPSSLGGISGSACYLTTSSKIPTTRLKQIAATHPILSQNVHVGLQNVHTLSISTVLILENILTNVLPNFIQQKATSSHPIKLVVIDALTELFNSGVKPSKATMIARAKDLHLIASALHTAASKYNIAILVLNEVRDRFEHSPLPTSGSSASESAGDKRYHELSQWFGTADSVPGENTKEASLGLVWANHLNVRIMLTKTGRRRYLSDKELPSNKAKRAKLDDSASSQQRQSPENDYVDEQQTTLIRRLSVVFSSVAPKISLDYIVTKAGVSVLADD